MPTRSVAGVSRSRLVRDGIPTEQVVKMRVACLFHPTTAGGSLANATKEYMWLANSSYDPFQGDSDEQPQYYDQYANLYRYYGVTSVNWRITALSRTFSFLITVRPQTNSTSYSTATTGELTGLKAAKTDSVTGYVKTVMSGSVSCARWLNFKNLSDRLTATALNNADPSDKLYLGVVIRTSDETTAMTDLDVLFEMWQTVKWFEPAPATVSHPYSLPIVCGGETKSTDDDEVIVRSTFVSRTPSRSGRK
jgi:hypothetical protein